MVDALRPARTGAPGGQATAPGGAVPKPPPRPAPKPGVPTQMT
jgi:hypothetical protein